jgi:pimeloyl-ACP methyl ester carboxylesterase
MVPARDRANYKGAILYNPGGPGSSGTSYVQRRGNALSAIARDYYDIIGFDPRGVGATTPQAQCFDSESQYRIWELQRRPLNASDYETVLYAKSRSMLLGERCLNALGGKVSSHTNILDMNPGAGEFMSSASVVEDMVRISQALGQEKVNLWGGVSESFIGLSYALTKQSELRHHAWTVLRLHSPEQSR